MALHQVQRRGASGSSAVAMLGAGATGIACVACCAVSLGFNLALATAICGITRIVGTLDWSWLGLLIPVATWVWGGVLPSAPEIVQVSLSRSPPGCEARG
jgi:hypothetical protein